MSTSDDVIDKRMANALFAEAEPGRAARWMLGLEGRAGLAIAKRLVGGIWVGGNARLRPETLEFHPNRLNRLAHGNADALSIVIPLREIKAVTDRFGVATRIIDIQTQEATLSLRCYRAMAFAQAIEAARRRAAGDTS